MIYRARDRRTTKTIQRLQNCEFCGIFWNFYTHSRRRSRIVRIIYYYYFIVDEINCASCDISSVWSNSGDIIPHLIFTVNISSPDTTHIKYGCLKFSSKIPLTLHASFTSWGTTYCGNLQCELLQCRDLSSRSQLSSKWNRRILTYYYIAYLTPSPPHLFLTTL